MSELQQRKRPWYTEDILYIIAKGLLARIPDRYPPLIDFRERNCYTYFMSHNKMAMRTIISQFAKFKRIVFSKDGEEKIEFYKNDSFKLYGYGLQSEEFGGPYYVLPGMLEYIIENGKLRVNTIKTQRFLRDDHSTDIKEYGEMNSLKAFCALFLGKQVQIPDGLNNNLLVEKFSVNETTDNMQNNFEAILAIDAVELKLDICNMHTNLIDCSQYNSHIIAQNTTKITFDIIPFDVYCRKEDREKFITNFENFCHFIVRVCPNLNNLHIKIMSCSSLKSIDASPDEYIDILYSTIKSMEAGIKSIDIGNENLQISIELFCTFIPRPVYDKLPIQSHDLFKLGSPSTMENAFGPYIARILDCVDALGRIHKLQFNIHEFPRFG